MMDLFCEVDGLFPSVYQFYDSVVNPSLEQSNKEYIFTNVQEAVRLAKEVATRCPAQAAAAKKVVLPVWVYTWMRYHGTPNLVSNQDAKMYWEQSYAAGATGLVLWGDEPTKTMALEFGAWWQTNFTAMINSWQPAPPWMGR